MSFTADLSKWCKDTAPQFIDRVVRTSVVEIGNRVVLRSPVGDAKYWQSPPPPGYVGGRFRGNWQHGFNAIPSGSLDVTDKTGDATISGIKSGALSNPSAGITYIVNNLPYAQRIENGWSRQAPEGIVSLVELEFPEIFRRASA
jgi:hypothetical protein